MAYSQQIRDFQRRMEAIPKALRDEVLAVNRTNANELADGIRQLAQEHSVSGELVDSIKVTEPGGHTPSHSMGGSVKAGELQFLVSAGNDDVRYAAHVEFGTVHAPAHPFFWPAVRALGRRHRSRLNRAVRAVLKKWSVT
jgi:HK97 gp10 family phage protein